MMKKTPDTIDLLFSLDTTGSMYPALTQARRNIKDTLAYLFARIPNLRVGGKTHGDYCDEPRAVETLDLTSSQRSITEFFDNARRTNGCNEGAVYERILKEARGMDWTSGKQKAVVLIGDTYPHCGGARNLPNKCECDNYGRYGSFSVWHPMVDWRNEVQLLTESGIKVYPVRALASYNSEADFFWHGIAEEAGSPLITLEQFEDVSDLIIALCLHTAGQLDEFESVMKTRFRKPSQAVEQAVASLAGRRFSRRRASVAHGLNSRFRPVPPDRFQVIEIRREDTDSMDDNRVQINDFVRAQGLVFKTGRGFYEFTKPVKVQDYKEVIVQDRDTGDMFTGNEARVLLGIPTGKYGTATVRPGALTKWRGFIQSTSVTRKLHSGTKFLYEVQKF